MRLGDDALDNQVVGTNLTKIILQSGKYLWRTDSDTGIPVSIGSRWRFFVKSSDLDQAQVLTASEEAALVSTLERDSSSSVLFDRHFYIFDLVLRDRAANFEWVNMVREPVSRMVSQFHYLR